MTTSERDRLMAAALFEIRILLSGYLGGQCEADSGVRLAAHLAYALHDDALAILEGNGEFDLCATQERIRSAEAVVGSTYADNGGCLKGN